MDFRRSISDFPASLFNNCTPICMTQHHTTYTVERNDEMIELDVIVDVFAPSWDTSGETNIEARDKNGKIIGLTDREEEFIMNKLS